VKITIIGAGHIGGATARGFARAGEKDITVTARSAASLAGFEEFRCLTDNQEAVKGADVIVISVKTTQFPDVAEHIRDVIVPGQIVVCMAAQVSADTMSELLKSSEGSVPAMAYCIPNTAIEIGSSMTFISDVTAGDDGIAVLKDLFGKVGETEVVPIDMLPAGIALASCGMGYVFKYICAGIQAGFTIGFDEKVAIKAVRQTVKGAVLLLEHHGVRPEKELRGVATPGGLTERGVMAMDEAGFTEAVIKGVKASM